MKLNLILHQASKREIEGLNVYLEPLNFNKKSNTLWIAKIDKEVSVLLLDKKIPIIVRVSNNVVPFLTVASKYESLCSIIEVDKGAVEKILNGADVMAPGITFLKEGVINSVLVKSPEKQTIAVGIFHSDWRDNFKKRKGKVVINLHYKNDKLFKRLSENSILPRETF